MFTSSPAANPLATTPKSPSNASPPALAPPEGKTGTSPAPLSVAPAGATKSGNGNVNATATATRPTAATYIPGSLAVSLRGEVGAKLWWAVVGAAAALWWGVVLDG